MRGRLEPAAGSSRSRAHIESVIAGTPAIWPRNETVPKARIRNAELTIPLSDEIREKLGIDEPPSLAQMNELSGIGQRGRKVQSARPDRRERKIACRPLKPQPQQISRRRPSRPKPAAPSRRQFSARADRVRAAARGGRCRSRRNRAAAGCRGPDLPHGISGQRSVAVSPSFTAASLMISGA